MQEPLPGAQDTGAPAGFGPAGRALLALSKLLSVVGGLVFVLLVTMSIVSITGRKLAASPVPGDVVVFPLTNR